MMKLTSIELIVIGLLVIFSGGYLVVDNIVAKSGAKGYLVPVSLVLIGIVVFCMGR